MKLAGVSLLVLLVVSTAAGQITPGPVVRSGEAFPIVADFNGDGLDDLVQERNVVISDGLSFTEVRDLHLPPGERVVAVLDVNGDRIPELLTQHDGLAMPGGLDPSPPSATWHLYMGNVMRTYANGIVVPSVTAPRVADVNGDGKDDLLIFMPVAEGFGYSTALTVLLSKGDGTFDRLAPVPLPDSPQVWSDARLQAIDVNHDGVPDLVVRFPHDLVILRGTGGGNLTVDKDYYLPLAPQFGSSMLLGDVDGDGNPDVIMSGQQSVCVLFADGQGRFSRLATAQFWTSNGTGTSNLWAPRNIVVGHFTRSDQLQIAASTLQGDLVVIAYEDGRLEEVARTATEFMLPAIRAAHFRNTRDSDLYAMGTLYWGDQYPRPRVFYGSAAGTPVVTVTSGGRGRARASRPVSPTTFEVKATGPCVDASKAQWSLVREGVFALAQNADSTMQALVDPPNIYLRLTASWLKYPAIGQLVDSGDGVYTAAVFLWTGCGNKPSMVTAIAR